MVLSNKISKKKLIIILALIELCTLFLVSKSLSNKSYALDDVNILNQKFEDGNMFAMFVDYGDGDYLELEKSLSFPSGDYSLNQSMSGCLNSNGDVVNVDIQYVNGTVTVKTKRTIFCYLYFDFIDNRNLLFNAFKNSDYSNEYNNTGYYISLNDRDTENPFFTTTIYKWNNSYNGTIIRENWNVIFAGSCWQMVRTTDNKGVKMIYNGEPNITEDPVTGNISYDCSVNRSNYNMIVGDETTASFSDYYYYGNSFSWDRTTQKYKLDGVDDDTSLMNSSNYQDLIGKFTCKLNKADGTCSTLYYIDEFTSGNSAHVIPLTNASNMRELIGKAKYDVNALPTYTYGQGFTNTIKNYFNTKYLTSSHFNTSHTNVDNIAINCKYNHCSSSNYYYGDSYSYNSGSNRYTITGNVSYAARDNLNDTFSSLLGKYTLLSDNASASDNKVYYIVGVRGDYLYYQIAAIDGVVEIPNITLYSITAENDQIYVQGNAGAGVTIPVVSNMSGYEVASFKVNGTTINGNEFEMPASNVLITDVKFIKAIIVESRHYDSRGIATKTYYENTFEGATSINVELNYCIPTVTSRITIYKTNSSTVFNTYDGCVSGALTSNYKIPGSISLSIPGNYIKIYFDFPNSANTRSTNYYGFKAKITPVYETPTEEEPVTLSGSGDGSGNLNGYYLATSNYAYVSSTLTDNNDGTYTLNNPILIDWNRDFADYINMYYCPDNAITCSYQDMRLVYGGDSSYVNYYTQNQKGLVVSNTYSYNNGIYTLTNPETVSVFADSNTNWDNDYSDFNGYYTCINDLDTSCTDIRHINITYVNKYEYYDNVIFSTSMSYSNGNYHLDLTPSNITSTLSPDFARRQIWDKHYSCYNGSGVCSELYYIYENWSTDVFCIKLSNGQYINTDPSDHNNYENELNAVYTIFNTNTISSPLKLKVDNFYKIKIASVDSYDQLVDREEIFCNNRVASNYGGWNDNDIFYFNSIEFSKPENDLSCSNKYDALSADETERGNGDLLYPVALLNYQEENLLWNYLREASINYYMLGTLNSFHYPDYYESTAVYHDGRYVNYVYSSNTDYGLRPALALKSNATYENGNGSQTNPYIVEAGNIVAVNNSDYMVLQERVVSGKKAKIYLSNQDNTRYEVTSFKLNGVTINGNVFTMPNAIAKITDIESAQVVYDINSLDNDVISTEFARVGSEVVLKTNSKHEVLSFKLNGTTITGNTFTMPSEDVTISDVELSNYYVVETETHNPFPSTTGTTTYYENTFTGATSITVELTYQTRSTSTSYSYVRLYKTNSSTTFGTYANDTQTTTTLTIPGEYLKIDWYLNSSYTSSAYLNYYGFKAVITPNYS